MSISKKKAIISIAVLVIIHLVGIIGFQTPYNEFFQRATFFHLLLTAIVLFINHPVWNKEFILFVSFAFSIGFIVEVIGVATGLIFGNYQYGSTLGFKVFNVPVIIGVNWLLLVYVVGTIMNRLKASIFIKSILGGGLLVFMDVFIEPVAIAFDYWSWQSDQIPFLNYFAWFVIGFVLLLLFYVLNFKKQNNLALPLFIIQMAFFAAVNLSLG